MVERTRLSAAEYYQLPEYQQHDLIQLIDGEVIIGMPPKLRHQYIVGKVFYLLMTIANQRDGQAFVAPTEVYLDEDNVYEPDVIYLKPDTACRSEDRGLVGAPDFVVEILSPSTAKYDRQQKYDAYQRHGVGEYWIVDPAYDVIEVWTLGEDGTFKRQGAYAGDDTFPSKTLGTDVAVKAIFGTS